MESECSSADSEYSYAAPPFSPINEVEDIPNNEIEDICINVAKDIDSETLNTNEGTICDNERSNQTQSTWTGFKVVGDNLDKNIHPSFCRLNTKTKSLHYFHYYSVLDRVDLSSFSDVTPSASVNATKLLVNFDDISQLQSDAVILISR